MTHGKEEASRDTTSKGQHDSCNTERAIPRLRQREPTGCARVSGLSWQSCWLRRWSCQEAKEEDPAPSAACLLCGQRRRPHVCSCALRPPPNCPRLTINQGGMGDFPRPRAERFRFTQKNISPGGFWAEYALRRTLAITVLTSSARRNLCGSRSCPCTNPAQETRYKSTLAAPRSLRRIRKHLAVTRGSSPRIRPLSVILLRSGFGSGGRSLARRHLLLQFFRRTPKLRFPRVSPCRRS